MPPGPLPEADGRLSSIHDSDNTSVIKQKVNSKPIRGDATEEYQTTKKVKKNAVKNYTSTCTDPCYIASAAWLSLVLLSKSF